MNDKIKPNLVAVVEEMNQLRRPPEDMNFNKPEPEIRVRIMRLEADGAPRNFSRNYCEVENSAGGVCAWVWAFKTEEKTDAIFSWAGPDVHRGNVSDYRVALAGMEKVERKMEKMRDERGAPSNACDSLGRWLEACGVKKVMYRPEGSKNEGWLTRGEWVTVSAGTFIEMARRLMPKD